PPRIRIRMAGAPSSASCAEPPQYPVREPPAEAARDAPPGAGTQEVARMPAQRGPEQAEPLGEPARPQVQARGEDAGVAERLLPRPGELARRRPRAEVALDHLQRLGG